ncbi:hypothetical protein [Streptomyces sp. bgisy100]|uniref:hypothetical protein n=1 Tax=Streptomyces sp. bgisy100 TaxID=3413783 RepID=UPI003D7040A1
MRSTAAALLLLLAAGSVTACSGGSGDNGDGGSHAKPAVGKEAAVPTPKAGHMADAWGKKIRSLSGTLDWKTCSTPTTQGCARTIDTTMAVVGKLSGQLQTLGGAEVYPTATAKAEAMDGARVTYRVAKCAKTREPSTECSQSAEDVRTNLAGLAAALKVDEGMAG